MDLEEQTEQAMGFSAQGLHSLKKVTAGSATGILVGCSLADTLPEYVAGYVLGSIVGGLIPFTKDIGEELYCYVLEKMYF